MAQTLTMAVTLSLVVARSASFHILNRGSACRTLVSLAVCSRNVYCTLAHLDWLAPVELLNELSWNSSSHLESGEL